MSDPGRPVVDELVDDLIAWNAQGVQLLVDLLKGVAKGDHAGSLAVPGDVLVHVRGEHVRIDATPPLVKVAHVNLPSCSCSVGYHLCSPAHDIGGPGGNSTPSLVPTQRVQPLTPGTPATCRRRRAARLARSAACTPS